MSDVIQLAAFRKSPPPVAVNSPPASQVRITITNGGEIDFPPVKVAPLHALAMLRMCLATAVYCLEFHIDSEG